MSGLLIGLILGSITLVLAFGAAPHAQACVGSECDPECLPQGISLSAEITDIDENYVTLCFTVRGRGIDGAAHAYFRTVVYAVGYPSYIGQCRRDDYLWLPECAECDSSFTGYFTEFGQ